MLKLRLSNLHSMKQAFKIILCALTTSSILTVSSQEYQDYIGRDHSEGIIIHTSDNHQAFGWDEIASGEKTLNGAGLDAAQMEAARFLSQATFGGHIDDIRELAGQDFGQWIDNQAALPYGNYLDLMIELNEETYQQHIAAGEDPEDYFGPSFRHFQYAWWRTNMNSDDLLRQRMAYALSQILVISIDGTLDGHIDGVSHYYDLLVEHAFGNYEDLLMDVSLHPAMGTYLTHINNPRNIDSLNIHPDENYAREIMQLFSIGLHQLNIDGSIVYDTDSVPVPTYDLVDINELAKVFTGLGAGAVVENNYNIYDPYFGMSVYFMDWTEPMSMFEEWHEPGEKFLMDGFTIPAGQTGMEDIEDAVGFLFNHQNVAPFLSRRLIQHFVKSNPTPAYIQRVAMVFNDNGNGERGDLLATLKAVLMDEEARQCNWISDEHQGKLREPLVRYVQFCRANDNLSPNEEYFNLGYNFFEASGQMPLVAPSVFNFFSPEFEPNGDISDAGLVGPEFQIHNSRTSIALMNEVDSWALWWAIMNNWDYAPNVYVDFGDYAQMAKDPKVLINHLDVKLTNGQLSDFTRDNIVSTLEQMTGNNLGPNVMNYRARLAVYLIMVSPDYAVLK